MAKTYAKSLPVTKADAKMTVKHHLATINHNLTHGADHFAANVDRLNGLSKVDPAKASQQAGVITNQLAQVTNQFKPYMKGNSMAGKIKKTGNFDGKSNAPGGGGRFKQMVASGKSPALAAYIGRKKYGAKAMSAMAAKAK